MVLFNEFATLAILLHSLTRLQLQDFLVGFVGEFKKFEVFEVEIRRGWKVPDARFAVANKSVFLQQLCLTFGLPLTNEAGSEIQFNLSH